MKLRLTTRIVLFFVFLSAVLLTSVGVLAYRSGNESLKAAAILEMLAAAVEKEAALDTWIEERLDDIVQISGPADVAEKAATLLAAPPASEAARSAHAVLLQELEPHIAGLHCPYLELFILEPESGKVMASTSPAQEGKLKLGHPYFDNGKKGLYLQAPYYSAEMAAPAMTAAIPLRATDGRVVAVLAARLDLTAMDTIAQRRMGLRQTEDSFLFNAGQFPVTQPRFIREPVVLRRKLDTEAIRRGAVRHSGVILAPDYRGVPSIAAYRWSAKAQLGLIIKIDQAEALAPARAFGWKVVRISGLALLVAVGLAFLLARTITRPLRALHDGVSRFAEGSITEPLVESSGDEVGMLAGQFNAMAARVVERTADLARVNEALKVENAERKRAELETQRQAAFARFNPNPVLALSAAGEINYFNEAAEEMARTLGLANLAQLLPSTTAGMVRECLASGKPMMRVETPIGSRVLSWSFFSVKFSNTVHGYAGDITERKRAEESLRLQSAALEAAANAIVITDHNGTIQSVNPAFTALTGYTAQEAVGQNPRILKGGKQDEAFYQKLWQTISSGQVWTGELTNRRKDGSLYAEEMTITPLRNADGVIIRYIAIKQDITERLRAAEALRQSEEQFRAMFDLAPVGVAQADPHTGQWVRVNKKMCEITGYSAGELLQMRVPEITYPEERQLDQEAFERVVRGEAPDYRMEKRYIRKDGALVWVNVNMTVIRDAAGQPLRTVAAIEDITERKHTEEQLRVQATALDAAANAIVITDHNGMIQWVNRAFTALTGYTAQEAVGQNPRVLSSGKEDEAFFRNLWQTISSGQVWSGELINRRKDGSLYEDAMTITPLRIADGTIGRYIAIKQDISERKRVEKRLEWLSRFPSENPNPVLRVSAQGVLEYANAASDTLLPTMGAEVGGTIKAEWQARIGETLAKEHSVNIEFQAGDRTFSASLSPVVNRGYVNLYARDITKRKQAEKALRESDEKFHQLADNITDAFWIRSPDMREVHYVSPAVERIWGRSVKSLYANPHQWADFILPEDRERVLGAFAALAGDARGLDIDYRILWPNGEIRWVRVRGFQVRDATDKLIRHVGIVTDITERKRAEAELENVHQQLVEASREGGMAEIATNVLHNVGNVLNSVNISTGLIVQSVKKSRVSSLARVVLLLQEHAHDLGEFITNDSRGKHVPAHLAQLSKHLLAEQETNVRELASLRQNVEHIKEIVAMQQNYATFGGVKEMINVAELVEDSLRLNEGALAGQRVEIIREFETVPPLNLEKHKILQILVNLLRNAKYACDDSARADKRLTVRVVNGEGRIRISVIDNGVGIPPENLSRIFSHGFTTRKDGHGFGLHSGALAAKEMGGSLTVHSDGVGQGAAFTLELPCPAREHSHE